MSELPEPKDFSPSLRNTHGTKWEATIILPVIGLVTVQGEGWKDAKMKLWLVAQAVCMLHDSADKLADPKDWTEDQWRGAIKAMMDATHE